jgi:ribonuclease P protein component
MAEIRETHEAHLPAQQPRPRPSPRLPRPDGDRGRPQGDPRPPRPRPQEAVGLNQPARLAVIRKRADFLNANHGLRVARPGFVLLVAPGAAPEGAMRYGVTVTRKIGGAVVRNRMKRRFRALLRELLPVHGVAGADHVMIGREGGIERDFAELREDLGAALARAVAGKSDPPRRRRT